jgi:O-antigen ligase
MIAVGAVLRVLSLLKSKKIFVLVLIVVLIFIATKGLTTEQFIDNKSQSFHYRWILWKDTFTVLSQHWSFWLVGVGPGNYYAYSLVHTFNKLGEGNWGLTTPHSQYFGILGELGLIGLFLFIWVSIHFLRYLWKFYSCAKSEFSRIFHAGALAAFAGMLAVSIFADSLIPSVSNQGFNRICTSIYAWVLLGLAFRQSNLDSIPDDSSQERDG